MGLVLLKILKSPWTWLIILLIMLSISITTCNANAREKKRWKDNYDASATFTSAKSQEVILTLDEFKKREQGLLQIIKENHINPSRVEYVHQIKWKQGKTDTIPIHDTLFLYNGELVPAEYGSLKDSCMQVSYARIIGDSVGRLGYIYHGNISIIAYRDRPKPKFWNWIKGNWNYVVKISSPCFPPDSIIFNKKVKIQ